MKAEEHPLSQKPLIEIPKGPYRYDSDVQQVLAPAMRPMMGKDYEYLLVEVRGWGHLQYLENGAALQDALGNAIARLPELLKAEQENERLKAISYKVSLAYADQKEKISELERDNKELLSAHKHSLVDIDHYKRKISELEEKSQSLAKWVSELEETIAKMNDGLSEGTSASVLSRLKTLLNTANKQTERVRK